MNMEVPMLSEENNCSDRMDHRSVPTRSEINRKICLSLTAVLMINVLTCSAVVVYVLGTQAKAPPAEELPDASAPMAQRDSRPSGTTNSKPYAELQVTGSLSEEGGILSWKEKRGNLNMDYNSSEGSLLIPEDGFYVIYLQVSYRNLENMDCDIGSKKVLSHEVWTLTRGYKLPLPIIKAIETVSCKEEFWFKTMHSNARVYLFKGEKLQVKLSPKTFKLVDMGGQPGTKTFWGVYLDSNVN